ncbi:MBL fold metallo-hydrolase [Pseudomonas sp. LRF_L74]|uniref:MBL fold metallo-hydrolase n=1 Tax=Pseudomonas sp. LRF_L74 TaxID=3369422 RepID=UPI003F64719A
MRAFLAATVLGFASHVFAASPLKIEVYNPGHEAVFPVSSVLVSGEHDAILIDAQFGKTQAQALVEKVRQSGKHLSRIYISHGDPDYYFGLQPLKAAFPDAQVLASQPTIEHIKQTMKDKLAYWGPQLGQDAPTELVVPEPLPGDRLELEGQVLEIVGLDGPQPDRTFVWMPSIKAVVGGVVLSSNLHVWMADTQTAKSHQDWLATLARIERLKPSIVVPGHVLPGPQTAEQSVAFTAGYIRAFDEETTKAKDAQALIGAMQKRYPGLEDEAGLELSAKVAKGEMKW